MAVLKKHPPLQSHYLVASPLPLAPAASHKFLTAAAVMAKVELHKSLSFPLKLPLRNDYRLT
jgi:hypothetical protein